MFGVKAWTVRAVCGEDLALSCLLAAPLVAAADTLEWALAQAYKNNPQINAQRAAVRATDEGVPTALSGYRPRVTLSASASEAYVDNLTRSPTVSPTTGQVTAVTYPHQFGGNGVQSYGGTFTQP